MSGAQRMFRHTASQIAEIAETGLSRARPKLIFASSDFPCHQSITSTMPPTRGRPKRPLQGAAAAAAHAASLVPSGANSEDGTPQPSQSLADRFSCFYQPTPFKAATYVRSGNNRPKKSVKQILAMERERAFGAAGSGLGSGGATADASRNNSRRASPSADEVIKKPRGRPRKSEVPVEPVEAPEEKEKEGAGKRKLDNIVTYLTPTAPPSLFPAKKYCDITGLPARYTDPKTKLHYRGLEVWDVIRNLGPGYDQAYLTLRKANQTLF